MEDKEIKALISLLDDSDRQVADHVEEDESEQSETGDRHRVLLADGRGVQIEQEGLAAARGSSGSAHRLAAGCFDGAHVWRLTENER